MHASEVCGPSWCRQRQRRLPTQATHAFKPDSTCNRQNNCCAGTDSPAGDKLGAFEWSRERLGVCISHCQQRCCKNRNVCQQHVCCAGTDSLAGDKLGAFNLSMQEPPTAWNNVSMWLFCTNVLHHQQTCLLCKHWLTTSWQAGRFHSIHGRTCRLCQVIQSSGQPMIVLAGGDRLRTSDLFMRRDMPKTSNVAEHSSISAHHICWTCLLCRHWLIDWRQIGSLRVVHESTCWLPQAHSVL